MLTLLVLSYSTGACKTGLEMWLLSGTVQCSVRGGCEHVLAHSRQLASEPDYIYIFYLNQRFFFPLINFLLLYAAAFLPVCCANLLSAEEPKYLSWSLLWELCSGHLLWGNFFPCPQPPLLLSWPGTLKAIITSSELTALGLKAQLRAIHAELS